MTKIAPPTLEEFLAELPSSIGESGRNRISAAYAFAGRAHGDARRETGERYIDHVLGVARIMLQLGVDATTLTASILHDILYPHTAVTIADVEKAFGPEVATLVAGLETLYAYARLAEKPDQDGKIKTVDTIRRAIFSIVEGDIRIILIRMADNIQGLRQAATLDPARRQKLAYEALHIYAPLANRLGVWQLKWELEDLAFRYLNPEQFHAIAGQLAERRAQRAANIETAANLLRARIDEMKLAAAVIGRPKHIYSIYRKMQRKDLDLEQIHDIQALRVILRPPDPAAYARMSVKQKEEVDRTLCYQVLGAVHSLWQPIPREFDDYIAAPKSNGYKSLHTAVIDPTSGQKLEVQIRTQRMHEEAEKGVAAHWAYKEGGGRVSSSVQRRIQSLRDLLTVLQESNGDMDSDEALESEILGERIFVFTPKGDVVDLPVGATPIDFAYQIHSGLGHSCAGARVNGRIVSLDYKLKSGDHVDIIKNKRGKPSRDWLNASLGYTGSARTRSKIRRWFRKQERGVNIQQGREVVERELRRLGLADRYSVEEIALALDFDDVKDFLARVGFGDILSTQISGVLARMEMARMEREREAQKEEEGEKEESTKPLALPEQGAPKGITVQGVSGLPTKMARCCSPLPPDKIVGYITRGHGVTIHRDDCAQLAAIRASEPLRLIDVDWGLKTETFQVPIVVTAFRRPNLVDDMAAILRGQHVSAPRTKTITKDSQITIYLVAEVTGMAQLNWLLNKFENLPNVIEARRQPWS